MNICFTSWDFSPNTIDGIKRVYRALAEDFYNTGYKVYQLTIGVKEPQIEHIGCIRQYYLPNNNEYAAKENIHFFQNFITEKNIDLVIHLHGEIETYTQLCVEVKKLTNVKLITHLHFSPTFSIDTAKNKFFIKWKLGHSPVKWTKDFLLYLKFYLLTKRELIADTRNLYTNIAKNSDRVVVISNKFIDIIKTKIRIHNKYLEKFTAINNPITTNTQEEEY